MLLHQLSSQAKARLLLIFAVLTIAGSVWGISVTQRHAADRSFEESRAAGGMLTEMLNQETGVRGYLLTHQAEFLAPFESGVQRFDQQVAAARSRAEGGERAAIASQVSTARDWQRLAREALAEAQAHPGRAIDLDGAVVRKRVFDRLRAQNSTLQNQIAARRGRDLDRAALLSVLVIVVLALLFGVVGYVLIDRQARADRERRQRERNFRETQAEFSTTMQVMKDESEAHELVKRHLERSIPDSLVVVLNRNNSENRLIATTDVPAGSALAETVADAEPEACLAIRLARPHAQTPGDTPLMSCGLCGKSAAQIICVPSLVGGEVIGSVNVEHAEPLEPDQHARIEDSVALSSPVLANLRTLAIAEDRAATDALTGLPNARSCGDTLRRMVAQASRAISPLSALMLDLDHFKQINDRFGHGAGDDVLAAVGGVFAGVLRESDFVGRYGGEEFVVLLPDTDRDGAALAGEKVRAAIASLEVPQVERAISASIGVATYPTDALDGDGLLRMADRALYAAKGAGRNRVMLADQRLTEPA